MVEPVVLGDVEPHQPERLVLPKIVGRRDGDVATLIADSSRVEVEWGWRTTRDIRDTCRDAWRFQQLNPDGYR